MACRWCCRRLKALHGLLQRPELGSLPLERLLAAVGLPGDVRIRVEFRPWCGSSPQELRHQVLAQAGLPLNRAPAPAAPG